MDEPRKSKTHAYRDGGSYQLSPGVDLSSCDLSSDDLDRVVHLIQRHDAVFSKGSLDLGTCDKVPHKIQTVDETPISQPYRRIPPAIYQKGKRAASEVFGARYHPEEWESIRESLCSC